MAVTGEWYRIVSSAFLHFGIFHLALNMLLLFQLGLLLEPALGRIRFVLLYIASMLGGSAGVLLLHPNERSLHGGASGAVFGLLGAAAVIMFRRGINPLSTGIGTTIALNLFITFTIPGISIGGHLGGLVAGVAAGSLMAAPRHTRQPEWVTYVAPVAVVPRRHRRLDDGDQPLTRHGPACGGSVGRFRSRRDLTPLRS